MAILVKGASSFYKKKKKEIFKKYTKEDLIRDSLIYQTGKGRLYKILAHYFKRTMYKAKGPRGNISPLECLKSQRELSKVFIKIIKKPKFYSHKNKVVNVEAYFRCGGGVGKVANFCAKNARNIQNRYNEQGNKLNILDTSAGFGSRMSAAVLSGHNYCGIDPNKDTIKASKRLFKFYKENNLTEQKAKLLCTGSQVYLPELKNKFDLSFTSPPYFTLEAYSNYEHDSITEFPEYEEWLDKFVRPTIDNTYKYLKKNGYALINIKNLTWGRKQPLFDDWFEIFTEHKGFKFVEVFDIKHQNKKYYGKNSESYRETYSGFKEPVMVFQKVK